MFTIWDEEADVETGKIQKVSSDGPVKVDIDAGFLFKTAVDDEGKTVLRWIEEGQEFPLRLIIKEAPSPRSELSEFEFESFEVRYDHVYPDTRSENRCDLE